MADPNLIEALSEINQSIEVLGVAISLGFFAVVIVLVGIMLSKK